MTIFEFEFWILSSVLPMVASKSLKTAGICNSSTVRPRRDSMVVNNSLFLAGPATQCIFLVYQVLWILTGNALVYTYRGPLHLYLSPLLSERSPLPLPGICARQASPLRQKGVLTSPKVGSPQVSSVNRKSAKFLLPIIAQCSNSILYTTQKSFKKTTVFRQSCAVFCTKFTDMWFIDNPKNLRICGLTHLKNSWICHCGMNPWICGFAICRL